MPLADLLPSRVLERRRAARSRLQVIPAATPPAENVLPARSGFIAGVPPQGTSERDIEQPSSGSQDRATFLQELWEEYLACPWAWACVNVIARTVTAGGLIMKWDGDTGEGNQRQPAKPEAVQAFERLIAFTNPQQDIRQLMRNVVADLQVFGDAFIEVVWLGKLPVALYNLDCPTVTPITDPHGNISEYVQVTQYGQRATFAPHQVIHISLDSARPSVLGVSPTHAAEQSIVTWMFLTACEKEAARRGLPPVIHADHPAGKPDQDVEIWQEKYAANVLGPQNIGTPIVTKGGGKVTELQREKLTDIIAAKKAARDEIVSTYGCPPAKVGIIESGNLGGGTGSDQNKSFWLDIIAPTAMLIAEKLQYHLAIRAFGITGWHVEFSGVDYRDDQTIENIRDMRIRNGVWTINRARADVGEPPVEGGDDAVLIARQDIVLVKDLSDRSRAGIDALTRLDDVRGPGLPGPAPTGGPGPAGQNEKTRGSGAPVAEHTPKLTPGQRVRNQLSRSFPATALEWVDEADWSGPVWVAAEQVDTDDISHWDASHDPRVIARLRRRLRRTGRMKPVVFIKRPGSRLLLIADGHHRALAAIREGRMIYGWIGHVSTSTGPWDTLATRQHGESENTPGSGEAA